MSQIGVICPLTPDLYITFSVTVVHYRAKGREEGIIIIKTVSFYSTVQAF
jgi:hypothetical protein